jgi:hypothetical protein
MIKPWLLAPLAGLAFLAGCKPPAGDCPAAARPGMELRYGDSRDVVRAVAGDSVTFTVDPGSSLSLDGKGGSVSTRYGIVGIDGGAAIDWESPVDRYFPLHSGEAFRLTGLTPGGDPVREIVTAGPEQDLAVGSCVYKVMRVRTLLQINMTAGTEEGLYSPGLRHMLKWTRAGALWPSGDYTVSQAR